MSKLTSSSDFGNLSTWEDLKRWVSIWAKDVDTQINGELDFNNNIKCKILICSFPATNVTYDFSHKLGRIPIGFVLVDTPTTSSGIVARGTTDWTTTTISLRCSDVGTSWKVLIF